MSATVVQRYRERLRGERGIVRVEGYVPAGQAAAAKAHLRRVRHGAPSLAQVLRHLQVLAPRLRGLGVTQASVFGSLARDEAGPDSDIDIAVRVDPARVRDLLDLGAIAALVEEGLGQQVDLVLRDRLRPGYREGAEAEMIDAF